MCRTKSVLMNNDIRFSTSFAGSSRSVIPTATLFNAENSDSINFS